MSSWSRGLSKSPNFCMGSKFGSGPNFCMSRGFGVVLWIKMACENLNDFLGFYRLERKFKITSKVIVKRSSAA